MRVQMHVNRRRQMHVRTGFQIPVRLKIQIHVNLRKSLMAQTITAIRQMHVKALTGIWKMGRFPHSLVEHYKAWCVNRPGGRR